MSPNILWRALLHTVTVVLLCVASPSQLAPESSLPANANQFMHEMIDSELKAEDADHTHWMYRLHREDDKGVTDKQVIQSKDGSIPKTLLINGQPLTPEQRDKDEEKMRKLVDDPAERAHREKRNKQDEEKAHELLKAIPDAFIFKYDGNDGPLTRLSFTPNPDYNPPTRELTVYHAMAGKLWVDASAKRLAKIEGHLTQDVNFGWGLLGHLDRGGTFKVVQQEIGDHHWDTVLLDLNVQGRAVIFKTITVKEKEILSDFHRVPDDLTISKAFEMLKKSDISAAASSKSENPQSANLSSEKH